MIDDLPPARSRREVTKDYLEPRDLYDPCLLSEEGDKLIYSMHKLIMAYQDLLRADNEMSDEPTLDIELKSVEWLEHRVLPLRHELKVEFEDDTHFNPYYEI
jgi:hypothetical protein